MNVSNLLRPAVAIERCTQTYRAVQVDRAKWFGGAAALAVAIWMALPSLALHAAPIDNKPTAGQKATAKKPQIVLDAIKKFEGSDVPGAFEMLQKASKDHPHLPPALVMLANLYFTTNQMQQGVASLERATLDHPTDPEPHLLFGELALRGGRVSDAEAQFIRSGELAAKFEGDKDRKSDFQVRYYSGMAAVAEVRRQWETAQKHLLSLIKAQPQSAAAHQRLARVLYAVDKPDECYKELVAAVEADKADKTKTDKTKAYPPAALLMADVVQQAGKKPAAKEDDAAGDDDKNGDAAVTDAKKAEIEKWLKQAMADAPKDPRPLAAMANWLFAQEDFEQADSYAQKAEKLDAKDKEVQYLCGRIARYRRDYARAESYFEPIVRQEPSNLVVSNDLALVLAEQKDESKKNRALELAKVNFRTAPRNAEVAATYGWILYKLNQLDNAEKVMREVLKSNAVSRDTAYYVARLAAKRKDADGAQKMLRKALEGTGPFANLQDARKWQTELDSKRK